MRPDVLRRAQLAFAVAEFAADIGDDDPEAGQELDDTLAELCASPIVSAEDASGRLRFLVCIAEHSCSCEVVSAEIRATMTAVAAWLASSIDHPARLPVPPDEDLQQPVLWPGTAGGNRPTAHDSSLNTDFYIVSDENFMQAHLLGGVESVFGGCQP